MKATIALVLSTFFYLFSYSQLEQVVVQEYAVHTGTVGTADLEGYTTYRVYAQTSDPTDFVSSVYAVNECHPLSITCEGGDFFNSAFAGILGTHVNLALVGFFPDMEFDSYATIGSSNDEFCPNDNVEFVSIEDVNPLNDPFGNASGGGNLTMNEGAWFALNGACNGLPTGPNNEVLLFQVTTNGTLEFQINVQILDDGDGENGSIEYVSSGNIGCNSESEVDGSDLGLIYVEADCTDSEACNYDPDAIEDDGSCCYENCIEFTLTDGEGEGWQGMTYKVEDAVSNEEMFSATMYSGSFQNQVQCLPDGCYKLSFENIVSEDDISLYANIGGTEIDIDGAFFDLNDEYFFHVNSDCPFDILGCTDPTNCLYYDFANSDDGSCGLSGCTDITACNYDEMAVCDDGSCTPSGCTDTQACNFDPDAQCDDGSCGGFGCTNSTACNYEPLAACDNGSCTYFDCYPGCTDPMAENYNPEAQTEDGSCLIGGCNNPIAFNFNVSATYDDGSCQYSCFEETIILDLSDSGNDGWNGAVYSVYDDEGNLITSGDLDNAVVGDGLSSGIVGLCLSSGNYTISVGGGFSDAEISWSVICNGDTPVSGGAPEENVPFMVEPDDCLGGCANPEAENYSPDVDYDIGNCVFYGCLDENATNYDPMATAGDQTCAYEFSGVVFDDLNLNGSYQEGFDIPLPFFTVTLEPLGIQVITDNNGYFSFSNIPLGEYNVVNELSEVFPVLINPNEVLVNTQSFDSNEPIAFAISKNADYDGICIDFYPSGVGIPCNSIPVNYNICFRNMGNNVISGLVEVEYDPLWEGYIEVTNIDSVVNNTIYMGFEDMQPLEMYFYDVKLLSPSFEFIGSWLSSTARAYSIHNGETVSFGEKNLIQEITCAYDPNDKQVFPNGYEEPHFVLNETELEYLVRFQNVGNAPATDVLIRDTLDANLDLETFHLMANSHNVLTTIDPATREVTFLFENIMLPDTAADLEGSNGLVSYKITPYPDLPEETLIENTAYIYFDTNPAVITNTTWNTIFDCEGLSDFIVLDPELCLGEEVQASNDQLYVEDYSWTFDSMVFGSDSLASISPEATGEFGISLVASNPLCEESSSAEIVIHANPELSMSEDVSICLGETATINAESEDSIEWEDLGEGTTFEVTPEETTTYVASATNEFDCITSAETTVTVNPLPTAEFTEAGAELTATSASSYQWYLNGEEIEGATEMTYTAVENGNYSVEVTNEFGCSSISDELFVSVIGVDEQSENMAVLYPNPMINSSILQLNKIGDYQVDIYNANGQRVSSLTIQGTNQLTINRNDLAAGVYYIQIVQDNSILSQLPLLIE